MKERRKDIPPIDKITWYYRHWKSEGRKALEGVKHKDDLPATHILDAEWNEWMGCDPRNPQSMKVREEKEEARKK